MPPILEGTIAGFTVAVIIELGIWFLRKLTPGDEGCPKQETNHD